MNSQIDDINRQELKDFLDSKLGTLYKLDGKDDPIDCSGLVTLAYKKTGFTIPDGSANQFDASVFILPQEIDSFDLLFFSLAGKIDHVAIVWGQDENGVWWVVEASGSFGKVVKTRVDDFMKGRDTPSGKHIFAGLKRAYALYLNPSIKTDPAFANLNTQKAG